MKIPRPYQREAIDDSIELLNDHGSTIMVMATGLGKSFCLANIVKAQLPHGRIMVIADRDELLEQLRDEFEPILSFRPDLEKAEHHAQTGLFKCSVVVSSIQTQRSGRNGNKRWTAFEPAEFGMVVIDEADLAAADSYRDMIGHYRQNPNLKLLGCTATPDRHDGRPLDDLFVTRSIDYPIQDAIPEGWLVPVSQEYLPIEVDLTGVHVTLGDLNGGELREALAEGHTLEAIASQTIQHVEDKRTLIFADCVANAERITVELNRGTPNSARIVTGETPTDERKTLIADYRAGRFQFLVNVGVATRGFNVPEIGCIVMAAPTCSITKQTQQLGRGTRTWPGTIDALGEAPCQERVTAISASPKKSLLVLDIIANYTRKKLASVAGILGGRENDRTVELADEIIRQSGGSMDVSEAIEEAKRRQNAELLEEARRREKLTHVKKVRGVAVDPFGVFGIMRTVARGWETGKAVSDEQRAKLEKWRVPLPPDADYATAQQLIDEFRSRCRRGLCTFRQKLFLEKRGYSAAKMSFDEAHTLMDTIAKREGWGKR